LFITRKAARGLFRHVRDNARELAVSYLTPGRRTLKIATAISVLLLGWFVFGTTEYHLTVPAKVMPARVFHVTAPFEGTLVKAHFLEGQAVQRGDILCELDREELYQLQNQFIAELGVLEHEMDRARAREKPADVEVLRGQQAVLQARLESVDSRIAKAVIRSPIAGAVISGDLREHIGSVVFRGDQFFEVAPAGEWKIELEVPEADVDLVETGLSGYFAINARPHEHKDIIISEVKPHAAIRGQKNVYVAEARIDLSVDWIRPGMEGMAKISIGRKPIWWATLHRAIDSFRMSFWL